jgi:hypothetical protein
MKRILVSVGILTLLFSVALQAQTPAPKPGPEHQKLAGLVGNWATAGESSESPFGPAQKWTGKITSEWFPGNFAVVRHLEETYSVSGESRGLNVVAYDSSAKTYTWYVVNSMGFTALGKATILGDVWTALIEMPVNGKTYKYRGTLRGLGSDKMTYVAEYSEDGKVWKELSRSTDTRMKSK